MGYTNKDNLSLKDAFSLMEKYKNSIVDQADKKITTQDKKVSIKDKDNEVLLKLKEENDFFKSILGDYEKLRPEVLEEEIKMQIVVIKIVLGTESILMQELWELQI